MNRISVSLGSLRSSPRRTGRHAFDTGGFVGAGCSSSAASGAASRAHGNAARVRPKFTHRNTLPALETNMTNHRFNAPAFAAAFAVTLTLLLGVASMADTPVPDSYLAATGTHQPA
jgi:hypothetical protein